MEKSPIRKIRKALYSIFSGLDRQLGLILLGLAAIGFFTFLSSSQNTPVLIEDELRNLALSFVVMWCVSRIPSLVCWKIDCYRQRTQVDALA